VATRKNETPRSADHEQPQPSRGRRAILTGGAVGLAAVAAGGAFGRGQPAGAQTLPTTPLVELNPSGLMDGTDGANMAAVLETSDCRLAPGDFYLTGTEGITVPNNRILSGSRRGTTLYYLGTAPGTGDNKAGDAVRQYDASKNAGNVSPVLEGAIRDLIIDGSQAPAGSVGLHVGDGLGFEWTGLEISNFTGGIGCHFDNHVWWTEKCVAELWLVNNDVAVQFDATGGTNSWEYNTFLFHIWTQNNPDGTSQQGVLVTPGASSGGYIRGGTMICRGNFRTGNGAVLELGTGSTSIQEALLSIQVESSAASSYPQTIKFDNPNPSAGGGILNCTGVMAFYGNWQGTNLTGPGLLSYGGIIQGDPTLASNPGYNTAPTGWV
jgi:hypothetical protein